MSYIMLFWFYIIVQPTLHVLYEVYMQCRVGPVFRPHFGYLTQWPAPYNHVYNVWELKLFERLAFVMRSWSVPTMCNCVSYINRASRVYLTAILRVRGRGKGLPPPTITATRDSWNRQFWDGIILCFLGRMASLRGQDDSREQTHTAHLVSYGLPRAWHQVESTSLEHNICMSWIDSRRVFLLILSNCYSAQLKSSVMHNASMWNGSASEKEEMMILNGD